MSGPRAHIPGEEQKIRKPRGIRWGSTGMQAIPTAKACGCASLSCDCANSDI